MKVAIVSDCYLPEVNGISFCVKNLAEELTKKHHTKVLVPDYEGKDIKGDEEAGFEIIRFKSAHVPLDQRTQFVWPDTPKLKKILDEFRPDIIHCHTMGVLGLLAMGLGKELGIKTVLTYHTLVAGTLSSYPGFKLVRELTEKAMWEFSRNQCERVDGLITPSQSVSEELTKHGVTRKVEVIANGVETDKFRRTIEGEKYRLAYAGRISFEKGVDVLIEAFEKIKKSLPEASLYLAGTGPAILELQKFVSDKGIEGVNFLGNIDRDKLPEFYSRAELFVTAAQFEVNPLVVLEAMACGLPVVGANKGGMMQGPVVTGVNGVLVDEVSASGYAKLIISLLQNRSKMKDLSQKARKTAEKYSVAEMARRTIEVYSSLTG